MSMNHPVLLYKSDDAMYSQIINFLSKGIDHHERCVFLTTKPDGDKIFQELKNLKDQSDVVKLFSYFSLPDPVFHTEEFSAKTSKIFKKFFNENFVGRIAFRVLGDMSRHTPESVSKVEEAEKYLHSISGNKRKFLCTLEIGEDNESSKKMKQIALGNHDHILYENNDGNFSKTKLN